MFVQCLDKDWDVNSGCDRRLEEKVERGRWNKKRRKDRCGGFILDEADESDDEINELIEETAVGATKNKIYESVISAREGHQGISGNSILSKLVSNLQRFYTLYYYMYNFGFKFLFSLT